MFPGDVEAQILLDENTDPASLHLSNCSVDGAVIGKVTVVVFSRFCFLITHTN